MKKMTTLKRVLVVLGVALGGGIFYAWWVRNNSLMITLQVAMIVYVLIANAVGLGKRGGGPQKPPNLKVEKVVAIVLSVVALVPLVVPMPGLTLTFRLAFVLGLAVVGAVPAWDIWLHHKRQLEGHAEEETKGKTPSQL